MQLSENQYIEIEKIVKNIKITNLDYEKLLTGEDNSVFIFLNPP